MATVLGMLAAGFAFAGSSKIVNTIFPNERGHDYTEEVKRHNLAIEAYTRDKEAYEKQLSELAYQEHQRDRNQKAAEIEHGKSVESIKTYKKEIKPPRLEDYLTRYAVHDVQKTSTAVNWSLITLTCGVLSGLYIYGTYGRRRGHRDE